MDGFRFYIQVASITYDGRFNLSEIVNQSEDTRIAGVFYNISTFL